MKYFKFLVALAFLMIGCFIASAQTSSQKIDGKFIFANPIPMPLGRYVQLADSSVAFIVQNYLASEEPRLQTTFFMKFQIKRHIPELEFMSFRAESFGKNKFYMKFKRDQNAMEILSDAIADERVKEVAVPWSYIYKGDMETIYRKLNGQQMKFEDSSIYRRVLQSNVKLVGFDSDYIILTEPASLKFYSEDGLSRLYFTIDVPYSDVSRKSSDNTAVYPSYAIVSTASESFRAVLKAQDMQGVTVLFFENFSLPPRDMDKLLTEPVEITVYKR